MSIELFINIIVICLLVPTIIFAIILNKRLEVLRSSRADLGRLIEAFNDATTRAESGIPRLKQAADSAGSQLKDQIQKAQTLRDDMAFMIERAENVVARLDGAMRSSPRAPLTESNSAFMEEKEEQLFTQKRTGSTNRKRALVESPEDLISSAVSAAEDILRDVEGMMPPKAEPKPYTAMSDDIGEAGERSEAERELLKALQAMR